MISKRDKVSKKKIMKTENTFGTNTKNKGIICYSCGIPGHKASKCRKKQTKEILLTFENPLTTIRLVVNQKTKLKLLMMPKKVML